MEVREKEAEIIRLSIELGDQKLQASPYHGRQSSIKSRLTRSVRESTPSRPIPNEELHRAGLSRQNSNTTIKGGSYSQLYTERRQMIESAHSENAAQTEISMDEMRRLINRLQQAERQLTSDNLANEEITEQLLQLENQCFKQR